MAVRRHIPNQLTVARLGLAAAFFFTLNQYQYHPADPQTAVLATAFVLFLVAAFTDFLDGYLARRWHVVSLFGRIIDPVADKLLIIGAFIYLAGPRFGDPQAPGQMISGVYPWMVVVILFRELGVTSIRATLESQGVNFQAKTAGKWKMILQTAVIPLLIVAVWLGPRDNAWVAWTRDIAIWLTIIVTVISGLPYVAGTAAAAAGRLAEPNTPPDRPRD